MSSNLPIVKVAVIQDSPIFLDKAATLEKVERLIKKAAAGGSKLVLFPETFFSGYPDWVWTLPPSKKPELSSLFSALYETALTVGDETTNKLCQAASEAGIYLIIGINEKDSSSNSSLYNSMLYINPKGEIMGTHRKLIPTGGERLMYAQGFGDSLLSFDTEFGKIGGLICWENFMPLARNSMYSAGVQIYFAPTWDSSEGWHNAMRYIAREGGMFVISCAQAIRKDEIDDSYEFKKLYADDREWINKGNSCIIDPTGKTLVGPVEASKEILYAELDMNLIPQQKWLFDVAGHYARPDVFDYLIK